MARPNRRIGHGPAAGLRFGRPVNRESLPWQRVEEVFSEALQRPAPERRAFLESACEGNPTLRSEVESLLSAHEGGPAPLELRYASAGDATIDPLTGSVVGPYRLLELLGIGGMGRVYLAERTDGAYRQRVAVKIVRPLRRTPELLERFQLEREVLARLEHPNIATLLDGGVTGEGLPYLVMQYIDGESILEHCDRRGLSIDRRLALLEVVCRAVEYAHSHLVVHRDLKPSNILVTDAGEVKLLDFGIAKLLDPALVDMTLHETRAESRLATPLHAAPEQISGTPVTTATDVYALGLLLYQLLCGRLPYRLTGVTRAELEKAVLSDPLRQPRAALLDSSTNSEVPWETSPPEAVAALRGTSVRDLGRTLRGDVARIALMALRKEPERRYRSAGTLADDLRRYLRREPVVAHRDSMGYRARRFIGRHPVGVTAAGLFVAGLIAFSLSVTVQSRRLGVERDRAEALVDSLTGIFTSVLPGRVLDDSVPVTELLERLEKIADQQPRPSDRAGLLRQLGTIHSASGRPLEALPYFERALELVAADADANDEQVLELRFEIARAHLLGGDSAIAQKLFRELVDGFAEAFEPDDRRRLLPLDHLARLEHPGPAITMHLEILDHQRALLVRQEGRTSPDYPVANVAVDIAATLNNLGNRYRDLLQDRVATSYYRQSLDILEERLDRRHPAALIVRHNLATVTEDPAASLATLEELLRTGTEVFGADSYRVAGMRRAIGAALRQNGRLTESLEALREAESVFLGSVDPDHSKLGKLAIETARTLRALGRAQEALELCERAESARPNDLDLGIILTLRSRLLADLGRDDEAVTVADRAVDHLESVANPSTGVDWRLIQARVARARALLGVGEPGAARTLLEAVLTAGAGEENTPPWYPSEPRLALGLARLDLGEIDVGLETIESAWDAYEGLPARDASLSELARDALGRRLP